MKFKGLEKIEVGKGQHCIFSFEMIGNSTANEHLPNPE